jgi:hypothetical protein
MRARISYWLIPIEADKKRLQRIIDELASRFDAPVFEPHVTLYSGEMDHIEDAADVLEGIAGEFPLVLPSRGMGHSDQFTKTLFLEFASNAALEQISDDLKSFSKARDDYALKPHLSLLYAPVSPEIREALTREIVVPQVVRFDSIKAVATGDRTQTKGDVERWQSLAARVF